MFLGCLAILSIATPQTIQAQSTLPQRDLWVIGNNVINFDGSTGVLQAGTIGTAPMHSNNNTSNGWAPNPNNFTISNAYHDENGVLLFYIADSKVYDYEGRYIGSLMYIPDGAAPSTGGGIAEPINGYKEIAIVPDKCNPNVFYIVAGDRKSWT